MKSSRWIVVLVVVALALGATLASALRGTRGTSPSAVAEKPRTAARNSSKPAPPPTPQVSVEETTHDFGIIPPTGEVAHVFVLRNVGKANLHLERGRTTCKCTMSTLPGNDLPPGAEVPVRVASKIYQEEGSFSHSAAILTSDPKHSVVTLTISGVLLKHLATDPPALEMRVTTSKESATHEFTVYSQVWDRFTLKNVSCSLAGATWTVDKVEAKSLSTVKGTAGYSVRLVVPPFAKLADFSEHFRLTAVSDREAGEERNLDVPIQGRAVERVSVSGARLDGLHVLELGVVSAERGRRSQVLVKVNDEHRKLSFGKIEVDPDVVHIRLLPAPKTSPEVGLYVFEIEVPPGARPCSHLDQERQGQIKIPTDHPHMPAIKLGLSFAVLGE